MIADGTFPGRLPVVGVMGSGSEPHPGRAGEIGRWLAAEGVHLLTGGGGGVMAATGEAFCSTENRLGRSIGVLPGAIVDGKLTTLAGYPNRWVEIPIYTHLPLSGLRGTDPMSRNHINILSADVVIALPGGHGTASEVALAHRYGRPLVAYLRDRSEIPGLPEETRVESELSRVQEFVRSRLTGRKEAT